MMTTYDAAVEFHRRIEGLYPQVERHGAWFRPMQLVGRNVPLPTGTRRKVDCDRVFCALAIKAATTKRAVFTPCEAGDRDSASTLARVVSENGVLMRWLLGGTGRDRLETYVSHAVRVATAPRDRFTNVAVSRTLQVDKRHHSVLNASSVAIRVARRAGM
jgi:hypothetical protein